VCLTEERLTDSPEDEENRYRDQIRPDSTEHEQHLIDAECERVGQEGCER